MDPRDLGAKQLAGLQRAYSLAGRLPGIRAAHEALSGSLTSLAIRMQEYRAHQLPLPLQVQRSPEIAELLSALGHANVYLMHSIAEWIGQLTYGSCICESLSPCHTQSSRLQVQVLSEGLRFADKAIHSLAAWRQALLASQAWRQYIAERAPAEVTIGYKSADFLYQAFQPYANHRQTMMEKLEECVRTTYCKGNLAIDIYKSRGYSVGPVCDTVVPSSCGEGRRRELAAILETIARLKSLASQVLMEQGWLAPLLQQAVRAQAQGTAAALEEALKKASLPDRVEFFLNPSPLFLSHDASHHFGALTISTSYIRIVQLTCRVFRLECTAFLRPSRKTGVIGDDPLICIYDDMQVKQACEAVHSAVSNWAGALLHERPLQPAGKQGNLLLPGAIRGLAASIARPPAAAQPPRASTSSLMGLAAGGSSLAGRPAGGPRIS